MLNKILRNEHLPDEQKRQLSMIHAFVFSDVDGSIDWPYTHMYAYCLDRGLSFSDCVDWGDGANRKRCVLDKLKHPQQLTYQDELNRSKSRLNTLKMEIGKADEYYFRIITKTEAHIRFINSLWYAMQILAKIIPVVCGLLVIYCFYAYTHSPSLPEIDTYISWLLSEAQFPVLMVGLVCVIYALICWYIRHSTLEIMHYQRVRELTMILEAQYLRGSRKQ